MYFKKYCLFPSNFSSRTKYDYQTSYVNPRKLVGKSFKYSSKLT